MLKIFCFHVYAQNSLFIAENCNGIFWDIITLSCEFRSHRAGSQLKRSLWSVKNKKVWRVRPFYFLLVGCVKPFYLSVARRFCCSEVVIFVWNRKADVSDQWQWEIERSDASDHWEIERSDMSGNWEIERSDTSGNWEIERRKGWRIRRLRNRHVTPYCFLALARDLSLTG